MPNLLLVACTRRILAAAFCAAWLEGPVEYAAADDGGAAPVVHALAARMAEARFHVRSRPGWIIGVAGTLTDSTVAIWNHAQGRIETLRFGDIETIEVLQRTAGAHSRAWVGALMGAALGAFLASAALHAPNVEDCGACFVGLVVVGVGGGAVAGGLTGLAIGSTGAEEWVPVYPAARAP